jgi:orotate phosphoribosyltransferase-like protein
MKYFVAILAALTLTACAKKPESISASYISERNYLTLDCSSLSEEDSRLSSAYSTAATQQNNARTNDIVGVALLGLPVSSLSGDNIAPEIARLKGEREAVGRARSKRGC